MVLCIVAVDLLTVPEEPCIGSNEEAMVARIGP